MLNDDLPYLMDCEAGPLVEIPFTTSTADKAYVAFPYPMRGGPDGLAHVWKNEFDVLYRESDAGSALHDPQPADLGHRPAGAAARPASSFSNASPPTTTFSLRAAARSPAGATADSSEELRRRHVEGSSRCKKAGKWPAGVRLPIIISVHHQSEEACIMFPDGQPDPRDYYERQYGGRRGAWRLLEIMSKHGVLGTWIICGATCEKYPEVSREVIKLGHSIAGHGYAHEALSDLPPHEELEVIRKTVRVFEDKMGQHLRGWRTCAASHSTMDLLLKHFDFEWDASIWNDDLPYIDRRPRQEVSWRSRSRSTATRPIPRTPAISSRSTSSTPGR